MVRVSDLVACDRSLTCRHRKLRENVSRLSRQDVVDYLAVHIGQADVAPAEAEGQTLVVQTELMENGGVYVVPLKRIRCSMRLTVCHGGSCSA